MILFGATGGAFILSAPLVRSPGVASPPVQSVSSPPFMPENARALQASPLQSGRVETALGARVALSTFHKPVVFFAPWCPHCHTLLRYLLWHHDLHRVQLVAVGLSYELSRQTHGQVVKAPHLPRTIAAMASMTHRMLRAVGIQLPYGSMDYAPISGRVSQRIQRFPTVLWLSGGTVHLAVGDSSFVRQLLAKGAE